MQLAFGFLLPVLRPRRRRGRERPLPSGIVLVVALFIALCASLVWSPVQAQDLVHVVGRGEHLSQIAKRYGVSVTELIDYNEINDPNIIVTGQRLLIPGAGTLSSELYGTPAEAIELPAGNGYYTVRRGDTLSEIADRFGLDPEDLMRLNGLSNSNFVWVGQQLRLSARVEATSVSVDETERSDIAEEIYVVQVGDTLSEIAALYGTSTQDLLAANGLPNANFVWVGQRLRVKTSSAQSAIAAVLNTSTPVAAGPRPLVEAGAGEASMAPAEGTRWIEINLTDQTLTAWQGPVAIMHTSISSGLPGTPTVSGRFNIGLKFQSQRMTGPGYDLPGVPWVMYFHGEFALHGAYWHNNFGVPMSHGCVNVAVEESQFLYNWAPVGTEVYVHY